MPTKIVFTGGAELIVDVEPSEVMGALNRQEPFHQLKAYNGSDVYLAGNHVAYLEQYDASEPLVSRGS